MGQRYSHRLLFVRKNYFPKNNQNTSTYLLLPQSNDASSTLRETFVICQSFFTMTRFFCFLFFLCLTANLSAQDIGYGFKAGLNFNSFSGDAELDDAGMTVEDYTGNTGFHLGVMFTWKATDLMGLRAELLYSQKGSRRSFDGQSYYLFEPIEEGEAKVPTVGLRDQDVNLTTSYIDLPITAYFKPIRSIEIYGGASLGFLVSAAGFGGITYSGNASNGTPIEEFIHDLDVNYVSDDPGEASYLEGSTTPLIIDGKSVEIVENGGAYFEFEEDRGRLYRTIDLGLVGGISFYLSQGLFVSGRINYGLSDVTNSEADVSLVKLENGEFITRDDDDRNVSIQVSVGFSF